jgi:hypothetical protein
MTGHNCDCASVGRVACAEQAPLARNVVAAGRTAADARRAAGGQAWRGAQADEVTSSVTMVMATGVAAAAGAADVAQLGRRSRVPP